MVETQLCKLRGTLNKHAQRTPDVSHTARKTEFQQLIPSVVLTADDFQLFTKKL